MKSILNKTLLATSVALLVGAVPAQASHFRGAALVPTVDANGTVTVDAKSFWRLSNGTPAGSFPHDGVTSISVAGVGSFSQDSIVQDLSDSRRAEVNTTFNFQLPGAGVYDISWSSGSWVSGVPNAGGSYGTTSQIFWDGSSANSPIVFDLENIQQEVVNGTPYSDNLDVIGNVTYDDTYLATGMSSQAAGMSIDATGQIEIANPNYADNLSNPGADQAFSGEINAADGSSVEFVWLFDAVDQASNFAPSITDTVIDALVGDTISETIVATDPDGDPITMSFINFLDEFGNPVLNSAFDPNTFMFDWDSTGFDVGTYLAVFEASDGSLTDRGTLTINLTDSTTPPPPPGVSAPSALALGGLGLVFAAALRRRKKQSRKS